MKDRDTTTIRVKLATKEQLDVFGGKKDTYDDIIQRLMENQPSKEGLS